MTCSLATARSGALHFRHSVNGLMLRRQAEPPAISLNCFPGPYRVHVAPVRDAAPLEQLAVARQHDPVLASGDLLNSPRP